MNPHFFSGQKEFRKWLEKNHKKETEVLVGFYKVNSGRTSMTWSQSVDEALCFGWIDGVRRSIDEESYQIRFTPRKTGSVWSNVNIRKVDELIKKGLMKPAGLEVFQKRKLERSGIYSFENQEADLGPAFEKIFKSNRAAWKYFLSLAPSYRKVSKSWIMSAKQEATRSKRLNEIIRDSAAGTNRWKDNKYTKKTK
jgi:uncharacterized protein YdeI (YjbR/CyaY-like superfamily)